MGRAVKSRTLLVALMQTSGFLHRVQTSGFLFLGSGFRDPGSGIRCGYSP
jgi:hypothetical protein